MWAERDYLMSDAQDADDVRHDWLAQWENGGRSGGSPGGRSDRGLPLLATDSELQHGVCLSTQEMKISA